MRWPRASSTVARSTIKANSHRPHRIIFIQIVRISRSGVLVGDLRFLLVAKIGAAAVGTNLLGLLAGQVTTRQQKSQKHKRCVSHERGSSLKLWKIATPHCRGRCRLSADVHSVAQTWGRRKSRLRRSARSQARGAAVSIAADWVELRPHRRSARRSRSCSRRHAAVVKILNRGEYRKQILSFAVLLCYDTPHPRLVFRPPVGLRGALSPALRSRVGILASHRYQFRE